MGQCARWIDFFEQFDCEIKHRNGRSHANADALSRRPCGPECRQCVRHQIAINAVTTRRQAVCEEAGDADDETEPKRDPAGPLTEPAGPVGDIDTVPDGDGTATASPARKRRRRKRGRRHVPPHTSTEVRDLVPEGEWTAEYLSAQQQADDDLGQVQKWKLGTMERPSWSVMRGCSPALKAYWQQYDSIVLRKGVLYRSFILGGGRPDVMQFLAPQNLQPLLLELAHADSAGHLAAKKTEGQLQQRAYWYDWKTAVALYCKNCSICNSHHRGPPPRNGLLHPFTVGAPNERWCVDLTGEHPKSANGYSYILTAMDCFTKYVVCVPLRNKTAATVGKAIVERVLLQFGLTELHSDGGGEFDNEILSEVCRLAGVAKVKTTPYKPSSNPVERFHRTMHSLLAKVISDHQRDWDCYLAYITFCYNTSIHQGTGYTPYFLMHGTEARWNMDYLLDSLTTSRSSNEHAAELTLRLEEAYRLTREQLGTAAVYSKGWYDKKVKHQVFQVGEQVRILDLKGYPRRTPKWQLPYQQVGTVVDRLNEVTYIVDAPKWRGHRILHVDKLRRLENSGEQALNSPGRLAAIPPDRVSLSPDRKQLDCTLGEIESTAGDDAMTRAQPTAKTLETGAAPVEGGPSRQRSRPMTRAQPTAKTPATSAASPAPGSNSPSRVWPTTPDGQRARHRRLPARFQT